MNSIAHENKYINKVFREMEANIQYEIAKSSCLSFYTQLKKIRSRLNHYEITLSFVLAQECDIWSKSNSIEPRIINATHFPP